MSTESNVAPESPLDSRVRPHAPLPLTRLMYWSVRRELWENRSILVAPLAVAAVILFGFLVSTLQLPKHMRATLALDPAKQHAAIQIHYDAAAFLIVLTAFIVGMFYCLDALYGERRDRSVLFWKSLPVSDRTTVLSKATIPLVVLPLVIFPTIVVTQTVMLLLSMAVLLANGVSTEALWAHVPLFRMSVALSYGLAAIALWHVPIYGWMLLVSAWARRVPFLWAVLPPMAISVFEKIAFGTTHFASLEGYRLIGWFTQAFIEEAQPHVVMDPLAHLTPGRFLSTAGLWVGLGVGAIFLAMAVRLRRLREPI
ncbi:MAG TPA: ABC transporter permease [Vicinamibacteria bacterium]|nr:ABC transporter permease [Vicinamibacteria bacterium]